MATLFTNELLERLYGAIDASTAATRALREQGIPDPPLAPFFRMGEPLVIPVSPTSAGNQFPASGQVPIPDGCTTFRIANNNPFAVRLRGTKPGGTFTPVTATTGWLFMPGAVEIYTTTMPIYMSAMSVDGPFATSDVAQKAGTGVLELQYGTGA